MSTRKTVAGGASRRSAMRQTAVRETASPRLATLCKRGWQALAKAWRTMRQMRSGKSSRRLRVCDLATLGEKRFVAVVQFEHKRFLVGGGAASVSLLSELEDTAFAGALTRATAPADQRLVI